MDTVLLMQRLMISTCQVFSRAATICRVWPFSWCFSLRALSLGKRLGVLGFRQGGYCAISVIHIDLCPSNVTQLLPFQMVGEGARIRCSSSTQEISMDELRLVTFVPKR